MNYDVDYYYAKFEAIPEEQWCTELFYEKLFGVKIRCCALGHCGANYTGGDDGPEANFLLSLFSNHGMYVTSVNDGDDARFQQETPKQRILAALREIKSLTPCVIQ